MACVLLATACNKSTNASGKTTDSLSADSTTTGATVNPADSGTAANSKSLNAASTSAQDTLNNRDSVRTSR